LGTIKGEEIIAFVSDDCPVSETQPDVSSDEEIASSIFDETAKSHQCRWLSG
jgi:hypothetical protein